MFLFPRVCRTVGCWSPGTAAAPLLDCTACRAAAWCSHQHRQEGAAQHNAVCRALRLARWVTARSARLGITAVPRVADTYEAQVSVGLPAIPSQLDRVFLGPGQDITHWVEPPLSEPARVELGELEFIFLTNQLSGLWLF